MNELDSLDAWYVYEKELEKRKKTWLYGYAELAGKMAQALISDNREADALYFYTLSVIGRIIFNVEHYNRNIEYFKIHYPADYDGYTVEGAKLTLKKIIKLLKILPMSYYEYYEFLKSVGDNNFNDLEEIENYDFPKIYEVIKQYIK